MTPFTLELRDIASIVQVPDVVSFIGEDATGRFGILAHHGRMMAALEYGLARYRTVDGRWHYLMLPGGLLYFHGNTLAIASRRIFQDDDLERILGEAEARLHAEEEALEQLKANLRQLEEEMLRRLWRMELGGEGS